MKRTEYEMLRGLADKWIQEAIISIASVKGIMLPVQFARLDSSLSTREKMVDEFIEVLKKMEAEK